MTGHKDVKLLELRRTWYAKLKRDGFKDIEVMDDRGDMNGLLSGHNATELSGIVGKNDLRESYYRLAGRFRHEFVFSSSLDALIWELYAEGVPYRSISHQVNVSVWQVYSTVNRIKSGPFKDYCKALEGSPTISVGDGV